MQNINEIKRKKILYRSKYRGTKELDLIIGAFIQKNINDIAMLDPLIALLNCQDASLQACLINGEKPPAEIKAIFHKLQDFIQNYSFEN